MRNIHPVTQYDFKLTQVVSALSTRDYIYMIGREPNDAHEYRQ